jgi:hypothetical protein
MTFDRTWAPTAPHISSYRVRSGAAERNAPQAGFAERDLDCSHASPKSGGLRSRCGRPGPEAGTLEVAIL